MKKRIMRIGFIGFLLSTVAFSAMVTFESPVFTLGGVVKAASDFSDYGVSFYSDTNFRGTKVVLTAGDYPTAKLAALGILNDDISSIKIPSGYIVTVYANDHYTGRSKVFASDVQNLDDYSLNNAISSIRISIMS